MTDIVALVTLHANLRLQAMEAQEIAAQGGDHADLEMATAVRLHRQADALEELLELQGVHKAPPGQPSLFSTGEW